MSLFIFLKCLQDACAWWPSLGDSITFGPLIVETLALETPCAEATERTFRIMRKVIIMLEANVCKKKSFLSFMYEDVKNCFRGIVIKQTQQKCQVTYLKLFFFKYDYHQTTAWLCRSTSRLCKIKMQSKTSLQLQLVYTEKIRLTSLCRQASILFYRK